MEQLLKALEEEMTAKNNRDMILEILEKDLAKGPVNDQNIKQKVLELKNDELRFIYEEIWDKDQKTFCKEYGVLEAIFSNWIRRKRKNSKISELAIKKMIFDKLAYKDSSESEDCENPKDFTELKLMKTGNNPIKKVVFTSPYVRPQQKTIIEFIENHNSNGIDTHLIFITPGYELDAEIFGIPWIDVINIHPVYSKRKNENLRQAVNRTMEIILSYFNQVLSWNIKFIVFTCDKKTAKSVCYWSQFFCFKRTIKPIKNLEELFGELKEP